MISYLRVSVEVSVALADQCSVLFRFSVRNFFLVCPYQLPGSNCFFTSS